MAMTKGQRKHYKAELKKRRAKLAEDRGMAKLARKQAREAAAAKTRSD
ncbi:MAG: hypothetical protein IMZ62_12960 [Chloroflexi bacterium]|nr:hypothetical protein [Chloroflexota bacterium]MBE3118188.1 hypothetical protein [Candidatus Atribacteria bacterium]